MEINESVDDHKIYNKQIFAQKDVLPISSESNFCVQKEIIPD
jgi:hypothetical protein